MPGITRIHIDSNWRTWRTELSRAHEPVADEVVRSLFKSMGMELADGLEVVVCTKEDAISRYDWAEGVDVILRTTSGAKMTMQEKFLTWIESTATFEELKPSGRQAAWYYCTAQYYFVGYTRHYWNDKTRQVLENPVIGFQDWIMLDYPAIKRADAAGEIDWPPLRQNHFDGNSNWFRWVYFDKIPARCVIQRKPYQPPAPQPPKLTKAQQREQANLKAWQAKLARWNSGDPLELT